MGGYLLVSLLVSMVSVIAIVLLKQEYNIKISPYWLGKRPNLGYGQIWLR